NELAGLSARYRLDVGDGVGPFSIIVSNGVLAVERGSVEMPDLAVQLTADQMVRLVAGRFRLAPHLERGDLTADGDVQLAARLDRIFAGIANG
ncbi:MAG TPA: SCP2 sterol-binding domain-containing protein, partial [Chloroflexota bacterium]